LAAENCECVAQDLQIYEVQENCLQTMAKLKSFQIQTNETFVEIERASIENEGQ